MQILADHLHMLDVQRTGGLRQRKHERVVADGIDHTRNAARPTCNSIQCFVIERQLFPTAGFGPTKTNVLLDAFTVQTIQGKAEGDPLLELPSLRQIQPRIEFVLANQENLQQLVFVRLEIPQ